MKRIVILGSTGSIGTQTLDVVRSLPEFEIVGLAAGKNWRLLLEQIKEFRPLAATLATREALEQLRAAQEYNDHNKTELAYGQAGMINLAAMPEADMVVIALTGIEGIRPTMAALNAGKEVALANKETLVAAGEIVIGLASDKNKPLRPVDSEHSAIWQCLHSQSASAIEKIILTASGGPFRNMSREEMAAVTVEMALNHPNWSMGSKITIDSATMMNKGLEVIEARWLFGLEYDQIEVAVHPQSIIHSAVEFVDGSVLAQLGLPDMRLPIQYALTYPQRLPGKVPRLDLTKMQHLTFEKPDLTRFPSLKLAFEAGRMGGTMPAVLNGANEVAVHAFLQNKMSFARIPEVVEKVMSKHNCLSNPGLAEILEADRWARILAEQLVSL